MVIKKTTRGVVERDRWGKKDWVAEMKGCSEILDTVGPSSLPWAVFRSYPSRHFLSSIYFSYPRFSHVSFPSSGIFSFSFAHASVMVIDDCNFVVRFVSHMFQL